MASVMARESVDNRLKKNSEVFSDIAFENPFQQLKKKLTMFPANLWLWND